VVIRSLLGLWHCGVLMVAMVALLRFWACEPDRASDTGSKLSRVISP